jgi:hypothetical protein
MGVFFATGLGLSYSELSYTYKHADLLQILIQSIAIVMVFWLIIGGLLLFKKYSGVIALTLIITQIIVEFLSGFTVGMYFVPVTAMLFISLIVAAIYRKRYKSNFNSP